MKGNCLARHSKVGVPHRGFGWIWGTPQRFCMVLEYHTEILHGSGVPHRGFAWFWGPSQRFCMVLGSPTEGLHGSGVPHRGFTWFWGTPQRVCMVLGYPTEFARFWGTPQRVYMALGYPTEGLHKCLVFAVFWGERPKLRQQIPQWQRSLHQDVRILILKNRPNPCLCPSVTWWHSTCLAAHALVLANISSTAPSVKPPAHALTKKQIKLRNETSGLATVSK